MTVCLAGKKTLVILGLEREKGSYEHKGEGNGKKPTTWKKARCLHGGGGRAHTAEGKSGVGETSINMR